MIFSPRHVQIGNRKAKEFMSSSRDDEDVFHSIPPPARNGPVARHGRLGRLLTIWFSLFAGATVTPSVAWG